MKAPRARMITLSHGALPPVVHGVLPLFPDLARQAMFHWSLSHSFMP